VTGDLCEDPESDLVGTGNASNASGDVSAMAASDAPRGDIQVSNIMPNPSQDFAQIGFTVHRNMRIDADIFDATGMHIKPLYHGQVQQDQSYLLDINAAQLQSGVYQVRIVSTDATIVKQFMVTE